MKFVSLAPYYVNSTGHNIPYQKALYHTALSKKVDFELLLGPCQGFEREVFPIKKYFSKSTTFGFFSGFWKLIRGKRDGIFFFLETFGIKDVLLLSLFQVFLKKDDKLAMLFRRGLSPNQLKNYALNAALALFRLNSKVVYFTDSELIAQQFRKDKFSVLPIPHTRTSTATVKRNNDKIICYWPGVPREAKGLKDIAALSNAVDLTRIEVIAVKASKLKNVTLIDDYLDEERYYKEIAAADVILLPYDPQVYQEGTSGILVEAVCLGKVPLVKKGSWLAYELQKFDLHELVIDWNPESFQATLESILSNQEIREKLDQMQQSYKSFHNQKTFSEMIGKEIANVT